MAGWVDGGLIEEILFECEGEQWSQILDYEKLPFRCNYCMIHGHLIRECPSRAKVNLKRKSPSAASPSTLDRQVDGPSGSDCMDMDPKVSMGKNIPAAESPDLDPTKVGG